MRWVKKEFDDDGKPEWAVYIDEAGIAFCAMQKVWSWVKGYTPPGMKL